MVSDRPNRRRYRNPDQPSTPGGIMLASVLGLVSMIAGFVLLRDPTDAAIGAAMLAGGIVCIGLAATASAVCAVLREKKGDTK